MKDYLFCSRFSSYSICLYEEAVRFDQYGVKRVTHPGVYIQFKGGRAVIDNKFRLKYYKDRKLTDAIVLRDLAGVPMYGQHFWFERALNNEEAEKNRAIMGGTKDGYIIPDEALANAIKDAEKDNEGGKNEKAKGTA
jgi:hypothetical protein